MARYGLALDVEHKPRQRLATARWVPRIDDVVIDTRMPALVGVDRFVGLPDGTAVSVTDGEELDDLIARGAHTDSWSEVVRTRSSGMGGLR